MAQLNSGDFLRRFDLPGAAERTSDALDIARRAGSRIYESVAASNLMRVWEYAGAWDDLEQLGVELLDGARERPGAEYLHLELTLLAASRGNTETAREHLAGMAPWRDTEANEARWTYAACEATIALAGGDAAVALDALSGTIGKIISAEGASSQASRIGFPCALTAALTLGRDDEAAHLLALLADLPPGHVPPFLRAQLARGEGLLAAAETDNVTAEARLVAALDELSSLGYPYWLARVQTDLAGLLIDDHRAAEARVLLDEAIAVLKDLRAVPALERAEDLLAGLPIAAPS